MQKLNFKCRTPLSKGLFAVLFVQDIDMTVFGLVVFTIPNI